MNDIDNFWVILGLATLAWAIFIAYVLVNPRHLG